MTTPFSRLYQLRNLADLATGVAAENGMRLDATTKKLAWKFIASSTSPVTDVDVRLDVVGAGLGGANFTLAIHDDNNDEPGTVLSVDEEEQPGDTGSVTSTFTLPVNNGWIGLKHLTDNTGPLLLNRPYWVVLEVDSGTISSGHVDAQSTGSRSVHGTKLRLHDGNNWDTNVVADGLFVLKHADGSFSGFPFDGAGNDTSSADDIFGNNRQGIRMTFGATAVLRGVQFDLAKAGSPPDLSDLEVVVYDEDKVAGVATVLATVLEKDYDSGFRRGTAYFDDVVAVRPGKSLYIVLRQAADGGDDNADFDVQGIDVNSAYISAVLADDHRFVHGIGDNPTGYMVSDNFVPYIVPLFGDTANEIRGAEGATGDNRFVVTDCPFGAKGDGTSDDSASILAAIHAARDAGGGEVVLPPLTYNIATKMTVSGAENVRIMAHGATLTTPATNGIHHLLQTIEFDSCKNCTWSGGLFSGNEVQGTSATSPGMGSISTHYHKFMLDNPNPGHAEVPVFLFLESCENFVIRGLRAEGCMRGMFLDSCQRCLIDDYSYTGILDGSFAKGVNTDNDTNAESDTIRFCVGIVTGGGHDLLFRNLRGNPDDATKCLGSVLVIGANGINTATGEDHSLGSTERFSIDGFTCRHYQDHTFLVGGSHWSISNGFVDGDFTGLNGEPGGSAIDSRSGSHQVVRDTHIVNCETAIILRGGGGSLDTLGAHSDDILVQNNQIENATTSGITIFTAGNQKPIRDAKVIGNSVTSHTNSSRGAIEVYDSDRPIVSGNTVDSSTSTNGAIIVGRNDITSSPSYRLIKDATICDNRIVRSKVGILVQSVEGGRIQGNQGALISGGSPDALIELIDVADFVVDDNHVVSPSVYLSMKANTTHASNTIGSRNGRAADIQANESVLPDRIPEVLGWWRAADILNVLDGGTVMAPVNPPLPAIHNGHVTTWKDRIDGFESIPLSDNAPDNRPTLISTGGLGTHTRAVVRFDGTDDYLHENVNETSLGESSEGGVFVVFRINSDTNKENGLISAGRGSNGRQWSIRVNGSNGVVTLTVDGEVPLVQKTGTIGGFAINTPYMLHWRSTGGTGGGWLLEVNGTNVNIGSPTETSWISDLNASPLGANELVLGAVKLLNPTDYADADIAEVVIYDGTPDVGSIQQYLANSYGVSLPTAWEARPMTSFPIPLTQFRVWDAMDTLLPATAANDDLGLSTGSYGVMSPTIHTSDVSSQGLITRRCRVLFPLPPEYDDGGVLKIRLSAGETGLALADSSDRVDVELFKTDRDGGVSADLITTGPTIINHFNYQDHDFDVTATDLVVGDLLDMRITITIQDNASAQTVSAAIGSVELLCNTRNTGEFRLLPSSDWRL